MNDTINWEDVTREELIAAVVYLSQDNSQLTAENEYYKAKVEFMQLRLDNLSGK